MYADGPQWVDNAEKELRKLIEEKQIAQNPIFQAIVLDAEKKLNDINSVLMNDQSISDVDRKTLFMQKLVWKFIFDRFGMKPHDDAIVALDIAIDSQLNR